LLRSLLFLLYPLLIHLMLALGRETLAGLLLVGLALAMALRTRHQGSLLHPARLPFLALAAAGILFLGDPGRERLLYLPPVVISLFLLALFAQSLLPGRTPLITQVSRALRGHGDAVLDRYTRNVTRLWVAFFALMTGEVTALALFAPLPVWSLFTGVINYLLVIALMLGEYAFRVRHLRSYPHPGLWGFLKSLARVDWTKMRP